MKLTWLGHACFKLEAKEGSVLFDPYAPGSVPGVELCETETDMLLSSHKHSDHYCTENIKISKNTPMFSIMRLPCYHDDVQGEKRGKNLISIVETEGMRVAHLGDLGHILSAEQLSALGRIDVLMIPVGGFYTIDAAQAAWLCNATGAKITIPMHYKGDGFGYDVIGTVDKFTALLNNVIYSDSNSIEINSLPAEASVVVLMCPVKG